MPAILAVMGVAVTAAPVAVAVAVAVVVVGRRLLGRRLEYAVVR